MPFDSTETKVVPGVDIIDRMLQHLQHPKHWGKGHYWCGEQACLMGAYIRASRLRAEEELYAMAAASACACGVKEPALRAMIDTAAPYGGVVGFNDAPLTEHADIIRYLQLVRLRLIG